MNLSAGGVDARARRSDSRVRGGRAGVGELVDLGEGLAARHVHRLDERPVGEAKPELDAAVGGLLAPRDLREADRQLVRAAGPAGPPAAPSSPRTRARRAGGSRRRAGGPGTAEGPRTRRASPRRTASGRGDRVAPMPGESTPPGYFAALRTGALRVRTLRVGSMPRDFRNRRSFRLIRNAARSLALDDSSGSTEASAGARRERDRALALVHADLRVEHHVEVVPLVADLLDRVVHAPRARDRLVDRLPQLLEHLAEMIGEFHGRSDYRFRFARESRIFPRSKKVLSFRVASSDRTLCRARPARHSCVPARRRALPLHAVRR